MRVVVLGQALIRHPVAWPDDLHDLAREADAVLCNFEGCLPPEEAWAMKSRTVHKAHPEAPAMLRALGVTHLALANNHAWDFGHAGILATRDRLRRAGFAVAGAGLSLAEASAAAVSRGVALISVDAGPTPDWAIAARGPGINPLRLHRTLELPRADIARLEEISALTGAAERRRRREAIGYDLPREGAAFLGTALEPSDRVAETWRVEESDFARLAAGIETARGDADCVVVAVHYHHWAPDWRRPPDWLQPAGERILAAGADCVACTGPPLAYPVVERSSQVLAPGLGNLVFHTERGGAYDAAGLPVWRGMALIGDGAGWRAVEIDTVRP